MDLKTDPTILLVEDEALIALAEEQTLRSFGYKVVSAPSGEKALEAVRTDPRISLILMDIDLGRGMDGTEAARLILKDFDLPIVFLSGHTEPEVVRKTEKITSYGYIVKGSNLTVLEASIKMAFKLFEANRKTKEANNKLAALIGAIPDLILVVDGEGNVRDLSAGSRFPLSQRSLGNAAGLKLRDLLSTEECLKHIVIYRQCLDTGEVQEYTYSTGGQDAERFVELRVSRLDGNHVMALLRDVSERKRTEDELKKSQTLLNEMGKFAKIGAWRTDVATGIIEWTDEMYRICEVDSTERMTFERNMLLYTPASRENLKKSIQHTMETGEPFDVEVEINTGKGSRKLLHMQGWAGYTNGRLTHRIGIAHDVTEIKRAEMALLDSNRKYRAFFDASPEGIVLIDPETQTFSEFNDQVCLQLGYTREEFSRLLVSDIDYVEKPEDVQARIGKVISEGRGDFETLQITKQGEIRNVFVIAQYIDIGGKKFYHCIWRDITDQRRAEQILRESEEKYRVIFDNEIFAIAISDSETLRLIDVNGTYSRLYGYDRKELLSGMTVFDISAEPQETEKAVAKIKNEGTTYIPLRYHRRKDGNVFPIEFVSGTYELKSRKVLYTIAHDISDRFQAENRIKTLLEEKDLLLKEVHHRIKNNMATMLSMLSLQASRLQDSPAIAALENARNLMRGMGLLYEKLYQSENLVEMSVLNYFPSLLDEILRILPTSTKVKQEVRIEDFLLGVKELSALGIIINELLTNAVKYAFLGRDEGTIFFSAAKKGSAVTIVVADDGVGLPEGVDLEGSAGFGLMLVRTLLKQLGGTIAIERGAGTKYILSFSAS